MKYNTEGTLSSKLFGLTLTWDVLKFTCRFFRSAHYNRLTLTWDVLKSLCHGAIWMMERWLTLTWDVLKFVSGCNRFCVYVD